ncbi:MAG TPA: hypothetical protein DF383_12775 [Deltaproteobacteria bacterium]|nr:hypothetical protein [Deltaproteobacteria bacterium]
MYLETSALLAALFGEPSEEKILSLLESTEAIATSTLTLLESRRALIRRQAQGFISLRDRLQVMGLLARMSADWDILEISPEIQQRAGEAFPIEPVRSLDAIHLASALELFQLESDLKFLSLDQRVMENLEPLGITALSI